MSELKPDSENTEERLPETVEQEKEQSAAVRMRIFFMMIMMHMKQGELPGWNAVIRHTAGGKESVLQAV